MKSFAFGTLTNYVVGNQNEQLLAIRATIVFISPNFRSIIHDEIKLIVSQGRYLTVKLVSSRYEGSQVFSQQLKGGFPLRWALREQSVLTVMMTKDLWIKTTYYACGHI